MAKPWVDWLFLRGHVIPRDLEWRADDGASAEGHSKNVRMACSLNPYKALATLRLCMGIGDGAMRTQ